MAGDIVGGSSSSNSSGTELVLPRERRLGRATLCNFFATLGAEVVVVAVGGVEAVVVVGAGRRRRHPGRGRRPAANATSRGIAKPTGASRRPWG